MEQEVEQAEQRVMSQAEGMDDVGQARVTQKKNTPTSLTKKKKPNLHLLD